MIQAFDEDNVDVRSSHYFIVTAYQRCRDCSRVTRLVAVCLPPGHEELEHDEATLDVEETLGSWTVVERHVFLFHVENLSTGAQSRLRKLAPRYEFDCAFDSGFSWMNHCEYCGCPLSDVDIFCEPDGALVPMSERAARLIKLIPVEEAIGALAGGLADEPEFFDFMSRE